MQISIYRKEKYWKLFIKNYKLNYFIIIIINIL